MKRSGMYSTTLVVSLSISGQEPTEWWIAVPGRGYPESTSRIRDAPTTQTANNQPSLSTANTSLGLHFMSRTVVDTASSVQIRWVGLLVGCPVGRGGNADVETGASNGSGRLVSGG